MEQTARVLSQLGSKDQPSKEFQSLVRQIGEAKTKHVSHISVKPLNIWASIWDILGESYVYRETL